MLFTKTQARIMQIFCAEITKKHSIRQIAQCINQGYSITYPAIQHLIQHKRLKKDDHNLISLNYKGHFQDLAYIEALRTEQFIKKYKDIGLFANKAIEQIKDFFILLIFGSYAKGSPTKRSDVDVLMIIEKNKDADKKERYLKTLAETYIKNAECHVIGLESVKEMLIKRDKLNVMNETLNSHIIIFGAEDYYKQISIR